MGSILTEVLLGLFAIGALLLHLQHSAEIRELRADLASILAETVDTTGRVVNLEAAAECWTQHKKRNGKTA